MKSCLPFSLLALWGLCALPLAAKDLCATAPIPYLAGESNTIIEAKPDFIQKEGQWYTNDHCFVQDHQGTLHWFGINNPYPQQKHLLYRYHPYLGHATATSMQGPWKREAFAIDNSANTEYIGAPFVIWHVESETWVMVVETWRQKRRLEVYRSPDLYQWTSDGQAILPQSLWISTRDPHICKGDNGKYWIHVVTTGNQGQAGSQVVRIQTQDFKTFEQPETILHMGDAGNVTLIESPFLHKHGNLWYLFVTYAHRRYDETIVLVSDTPAHFDYPRNVLTTLFGHASEIFEHQGKLFISSCGPEGQQAINKQGITLSELRWAQALPHAGEPAQEHGQTENPSANANSPQL